MTNPTCQQCLVLCVALLVTACRGEQDAAVTPAAAPAINQTVAVDDIADRSLAGLLSGTSRPEADRARDAGRKPAEVIELLGIEPGMAVIDIIAASGWYTEVLSLAVGPEGRVVSQNPPGVLAMRDGANEKALSERLANGRLPNVTRLDKDIAELTPDDGLFDVAVTALNLHDIYNRNGTEAAVGAMRVVYSILKPGGVFGVIDHAGNEDQDNTALHRMLKADAVRFAEAAGFVVETDSSILHMASDDRTRPVFDEAVRGKTDRFVLKLRKPQ